MAFHHLREQAKDCAEAAVRKHRAHGGGVSDERQDRAEVARGVHKHERRLHPHEIRDKVEGWWVG